MCARPDQGLTPPVMTHNPNPFFVRGTTICHGANSPTPPLGTIINSCWLGPLAKGKAKAKVDGQADGGGWLEIQVDFFQSLPALSSPAAA